MRTKSHPGIAGATCNPGDVGAPRVSGNGSFNRVPTAKRAPSPRFPAPSDYGRRLRAQAHHPLFESPELARALEKASKAARAARRAAQPFLVPPERRLRSLARWLLVLLLSAGVVVWLGMRVGGGVKELARRHVSAIERFCDEAP